MKRSHDELSTELWSSFQREVVHLGDADLVLRKATELIVDWGINRSAMRDILIIGTERGELDEQLLHRWDANSLDFSYGMSKINYALAAKVAVTPARSFTSKDAAPGALHAELPPDSFDYRGHPGSLRFIGRRRELAYLSERIAANDSCLITGPQGIGKTALLRQVAELQGSGQRGTDPAHTRCCLFFDCQMLVNTVGRDQEEKFFRSLWRRIQGAFPQGAHLSALHELLESPLETWMMSELFEKLDRHHRRVVVLMDNLEVLPKNPRPGKADFLEPLFFLASTKRGLVLLTASRSSIAAMNRSSQLHQTTISTFFNKQVELSLEPIAKEEVVLFLADTQLPPPWYPVIIAMAGRHPLLLQAAAAAAREIIEFSGDARATDAAQVQVGKLTLERVTAHCAERWQGLTAEEKSALVDLRSAALAVLPRAPWTPPSKALELLANRGIVDRGSPADPQYRICEGVFAEWLADSITGEQRSPPASVSPPRLLQTPQVLCLNAAADAAGFETLRRHLAWLERGAQVVLTSLADLMPGQLRRDAGMRLVRNATIVIALLSADLFADELLTMLLNHSVALHEQHLLRLFPIYYRPVDLVPHGHDALALLPRDRNPVSLWASPDAAWLEITEGLRRAIGVAG